MIRRSEGIKMGVNSELDCERSGKGAIVDIF
jgi:hypothetical protein